MFADVDYSQFDSVQEAVAYLNRRIRETPPTDEPIHQILNRFHRHIDEKLGLAGAMPLTVQLQIIEHEHPTDGVRGGVPLPGMPGPRRPSTPLDEHGSSTTTFPVPQAHRLEAQEGAQEGPVKEEVPKKVPGPAPPPRRKAKLQRPEPESDEAEARPIRTRPRRRSGPKKHAHGDEIEVSSDDDEAKAKIEAAPPSHRAAPRR
ncbi:hypothetical protein PAPYR_13142 [Paratrimastix pyriformis]|uniref:Uncharacterized protein n=1 Tax=Paratrimastix pyriformis TaxID=342808 RepID=A0ABQ8U0R6_9EUKA|nr:hypothetical protein PAPYR_13142 [Paratrimastix pyriformis]